MKRFYFRVLLFIAPFLIIVFANIVVDPYSINNSNLLQGLEKQKVTEPLDYRLHKLSHFLKDTVSRIIVGDSRMAAFDENYIEKITGNSYFNLAYGGGTLRESLLTIEFAKSKCKLKEIVIGIPFNLFDASNSKERVSRALNVIDNPLSYYFSFSTTKATFFVIAFNFFDKNYASENPDMDFEAFWTSQLSLADQTYSNYSYPKNYVNSIIELKEYCKTNNISLKIILPPTHVDLQNMVSKNNLDEEYSKYKKFLSKVGEVFDYDIRNKLTSDKRNFKDPYHFNDSIMLLLIEDIWER